MGLTRVVAGLLAACVLLGAAACTPGGADTGEVGGDDGRLSIVTTTNVVSASAREVVGDDADVEPLMGPGVDPHQYRARASDLERLRSADLVLAVGLDLEGAMLDALRALSSSTPVVFVGEQIPDELRLPADDATDGGAYDPHVWFDVPAWTYAVTAIRDAVVELDPALEERVDARTQAHLDDLDDLHDELIATYAGIPDEQRVLVTSHDAFRYLGRAYDLDVVGIQGISTAAEATTDAVQEVADVVADRSVPAVFVETSVSPRTLEAVIDAVERAGGSVEIGGELYSDSAGPPDTPEATYAGMLRANAQTIAEHLGAPA